MYQHVLHSYHCALNDMFHNHPCGLDIPVSARTETSINIPANHTANPNGQLLSCLRLQHYRALTMQNHYENKKNQRNTGKKRHSSNASTKQHQGYIQIYHTILQNRVQNMISEPDIVKHCSYKLLTQHVKLTNAYFHFLPQVHAVSFLSESNNHQPVNKF